MKKYLLIAIFFISLLFLISPKTKSNLKAETQGFDPVLANEWKHWIYLNDGYFHFQKKYLTNVTIEEQTTKIKIPKFGTILSKNTGNLIGKVPLELHDEYKNYHKTFFIYNGKIIILAEISVLKYGEDYNFQIPKQIQTNISDIQKETVRKQIENTGLRFKFEMDDFPFFEPVGKDTYEVLDTETLNIEDVINNFTFNTYFPYNSTVKVLEDNYTKNKNVPGTHTILLQFKTTLNKEKTINKTVYVNVRSEVEQDLQIIGPSKLKIKYKQHIDNQFLKQNYKVQTKNGIFVTDVLTSLTNLNETANSLGKKSVTLSAAYNGNHITKNIIIEVVDDEAPMIIGPSNITLKNNEVVTIEDLVNRYSITDNYDKSINIRVITNLSSVPKENFTLKITAIDTNNNQSELFVNVQILNGIAPTIKGPEKIYKGTNDYLNVEYFKSLMTAVDTSGINISNKIKVENDSFTGFANIPGKYEIIFVVSDSGGLKSRKTLKVFVDNRIDNYFIVDNTFYVNPEKKMTMNDFISGLIIYKNLRVNSGSNFQPIGVGIEDYEKNYNIADFKVSSVTLKYTDTSGLNQELTFGIQVANSLNFGKPKENMFKKVVIIIISIVSLIGLLFILFKFIKKRR